LCACFRSPAAAAACVEAGIITAVAAVRYFGQQIQRVGASALEALKDCFGSTPATPPPTTSPAPQLPVELTGRIEAIRERVSDANSQMQDYFEDPWSSRNVVTLGTDYVGARGQQYWATPFPAPPQLWQDVGAAFDEVA